MNARDSVMNPEHVDQVQVGIIGAGEITRLAHLPVLKNIGDIHVEWIADMNSQRALDLGRAFGVRRHIALNGDIQLPSCDIALLATPVCARQPYLEYFSAYGTAILAEKPFAVSLQEHQRFLEICAKNKICCGYMRRTYANVRALRRMVQEQWFGRLRSIRYSEGGRVLRGGAASKTLDLSYKRGGGVLRDLGCHGLDTLFYITRASRYRVNVSKIEWDEETDRQVTAEFTFEGIGDLEKDECPVSFAVSWLSEQANRIVLEFDHVRVRAGIRPETELEVAPFSRKDDWTKLSLDLAGARSSYQAFFLEWRDVVSAFKSGRQGDLSAESALLTSRLVDDIYQVGKIR